MLYKIVRITDRVGRDKMDERNMSRLGREGTLVVAMEGAPMQFQYADTLDTLVTSAVDRVVLTEHGIAVRTAHAVYYFNLLDDDDDFPESVDWEEGA